MKAHLSLGPWSRRGWQLGSSLVAVASALAVVAILLRVDSPEVSRSSNGFCEKALRRDIGSQTMTTIGVIRGWGTGLAGEYPAAHAFGTASDDSPGAWCWVHTGSDWALFGVAADGASVAFPRLSGSPAVTPTGAPAYR